MTDCGATGDCLMPMRLQYLTVLIAVGLLVLKCTFPKDPYNRW